MINYETSKQRFPGYVQPLKRSNGGYLVIDTVTDGIGDSKMFNSMERTDSKISWLGVILPNIERQDLYDQMLDHNVVYISSQGENNRGLVRPIDVVVCPDDSSLQGLEGAAGLTYVANTGAWDYSSTTGPSSADYLLGNNVGDTKANGIFHNATLGNVSTKLGRKNDGASNTLLLSENIHKETEIPEITYCWMGIDPARKSEQYFGMVWVLSFNPAGEAPTQNLRFQVPFSTEADVAGFPSTKPMYAPPSK